MTDILAPTATVRQYLADRIEHSTPVGETKHSLVYSLGDSATLAHFLIKVPRDPDLLAWLRSPDTPTHLVQPAATVEGANIGQVLLELHHPTSPIQIVMRQPGQSLHRILTNRPGSSIGTNLVKAHLTLMEMLLAAAEQTHSNPFTPFFLQSLGLHGHGFRPDLHDENIFFSKESGQLSLIDQVPGPDLNAPLPMVTKRYNGLGEMEEITPEEADALQQAQLQDMKNEHRDFVKLSPSAAIGRIHSALSTYIIREPLLTSIVNRSASPALKERFEKAVPAITRLLEEAKLAALVACASPETLEQTQPLVFRFGPKNVGAVALEAPPKQLVEQLRALERAALPPTQISQ